MTVFSPPGCTIEAESLFTKIMPNQSNRFVSRAGEKLDAALEAFALDVNGAVCADFGCNIGGFTDCLLRRGASKVYSLDTGYGVLAWKLRNDSRVVVRERTNVLHTPVPEPVDLVVVDLAWTVQELAIPAAMRWLKGIGGCPGCIVSLLKPHYELTKLRGRKPAGRLSLHEARSVCGEVCSRLEGMGFPTLAVSQSALVGKGGNYEFLLLVRPLVR